ncbi:hypothetical protein FB547_1083 [Variovorax beijingensis]|uniref:GNAT family N-acetyltransferase n=1 Tax=Variovorax beijingensis TaxID=2496117 RepID=A0A561BGF5_9BURK|nr:hypothetical protein [Variovorax beijingensis]TWD77948.1 hypothetical protein FB547_1083 [Variovorax beijingensis]
MTESEDIELWDNARKVWEPGTLWRQPDTQLVLRAEEQWRGWMEGVAAINVDRELGVTLPFTYAHWPWGFIAVQASRSLREEVYAVTRTINPGTDGQRVWVEGLMHLSTYEHACRAESHKGKPGIYLDLIATAPWNLPGVLTPPRYQLVGKILMRQAVDISRDLGFKGRVGLHALDDAALWYEKKIGMVSLGRDPKKENLEYFELEEAAAEAFYPLEGDDDEENPA